MSKNRFCPNLNHPEAKALIKSIGLSGFYREYIKNDYNIPLSEDISDLGRSVMDYIAINRDVFTAQQQDEGIKSIIYLIQQERLSGVENVSEIFNNILSDISETRDYNLDEYNKTKDEWEKSQYLSISDNLSNLIEYYDRFFEEASKRLSDYGVVIRDRDRAQEDNDENVDISDIQEEESLFQKLNYTDEANFARSSKDTASSHIKVELSLIPKYIYENGKPLIEDGEYVVDVNHLGLPTFEDLNTIWNDMLFTLIDVPIGRKLEYLNESSNPKHNIIYDTITSNPNINIQNEFEVTFSKQQAKFTTVIKSRQDNIGESSTTIIDTNRSNPENIIINDWYSSFLESDIVKTNVDGNKYIDTTKGKALKSEYLSAIKNISKDKDSALTSIVGVLNNIGIDVSKNALMLDNSPVDAIDLVTNKIKFVFDRISNDSSVVDNIDTAENSLEFNNPFISEESSLEQLAKLENIVNPSQFEPSFIGGDKKSKYSFVNNSYLSLRHNKLLTDPQYLQELKRTGYASESHYLKELIDNDTFKNNFALRYLDTLGNRATNQTNKPYGKMNTKEKEYTRVAYFMNGGQGTTAKNTDIGYFISLVPSDKTTIPVFKSLKVNVNTDSDFNFNQDSIDVMYDQFTSEYNRVKETINQNQDPSIKKVKSYHGENGMGSKFIVFPMMNNILIKNGSLLELDDIRVRELVRPALEKLMQDISRDQISYWTELGLYNSKLIDKSYKSKNGINNKNIDDGLRNLASSYAVNQFIFFMNQTQLFSGDPALHGKGGIDGTWINYYKRMAKEIAPGLDGNFEDSHVNYIFLEDLNYTSDHLNEYRSKVGGLGVEAYGYKKDSNGNDTDYGNINPADAQEYTTLDEHLRVMRAYGKLSPKVEEAIDRLKEGGSDIADLQLVMQPMKPVYVESVIEDNINKIYYIKTSSFPLVPALTEGLEIDKLRIAMENNINDSGVSNPIGRAVYTSGVKLGIHNNTIDISDDGGSTINDLNISSVQVNSLPRSGFRIQQELPIHDTGLINEATQGMKLILNNLSDNEILTYNGNKVTGREAKDIYQKLHTTKMQRAFDKFMDDMSINKEDGVIEDLDGIANILKEEAESRNYPINDIYSIQLVTGRDGKKKFKIPLGFTNSGVRFESILNSIITNRVIKGKLPGFAAVQGASSGFRMSSDTKVRSLEDIDPRTQITWVNQGDTKLNYATEKNGEIVSADIIVPNYIKGINLKDYILPNGNINTDLLPDDILTLIGLRIPTQGYNSMLKFKVKGFLPEYMGDLVIVPAEITIQMGSDFDVDKMFMYNYHYNIDKDTKKVNKIKKDLPGATEIDYSSLKDNEIDNLIIQMFEDRLSDPRIMDQLLEPNGFGLLPEVSIEVGKLSTRKKSKHNFTSREQNNIHYNNTAGKMGCLAYGTKVLMYNGSFKEVQDVVVGDQLMGPDSRPRNVLDLKRGSEQMYWIHQKRGISYRVNESHILSLKNKGKVNNIVLSDFLKKGSTFKKESKGYKSGLIEFEDKKVSLCPYYLGLWLGDGSKKAANSISSIDLEIREYLDNEYGIYRSEGINDLTIFLNPDKINSNFKAAFNRTTSCLFPDEYKYIPKNYLYTSSDVRLNLLAGLIDSDGGYCNKNKQYRIHSSNNILAEQIVFLTRSLGFYTSIKETPEITKKYPNGKAYTCNKGYIITFVPEVDIPVKIERKKQVKKSSFKDRLVTGISIEKDIIDNYYGFELDGDHLFLLEDFTVTHNTAIFSLFSTFNKLSQDANLMVIKDAGFKFKNNKGEVSNLYNLSAPYNMNNELKSNVIMFFQSAAVDNANEQILGNLNINDTTMGVAGTMAMLGLPEDFIGYFLSQPIIREYVDRISDSNDLVDSGGEYNPNLETDIILEIINRNISNNTNRSDVLKLVNNISYGTNELLGSLRQESQLNSIIPTSLSTEEQNILNSISDLFGLKVFLDFTRIKELSDSIQALQSATNLDTKGLGSNLTAVESKIKQIDNLRSAAESPYYELINTNALYLDNTVGKARDILYQSRNIFAQIFPYATPVYSSITDSISESVDLALTEDNLRNIYTDIKSYILSSADFIGEENIDSVKERLLYNDKSNIASRWIDYSNTEKGSLNLLTKKIRPRVSKGKNDFNGLESLNTPASNDATDINTSIMYFYDMINSTDIEERVLAEDIVKYFIVTGAQYGPRSIGKYITYDILEKYNFSQNLRDIEDRLSYDDSVLSGFTDQYFQNNPFKAKSISLDKFPNTLDIRRNGTGILNNNNNPSDYLVSYNSKERQPVLYKLIDKSTSQDGFIYSKLDVFDSNIIKNYNSDENINPVKIPYNNREDVPTVNTNEDSNNRSLIAPAIQQIRDNYNTNSNVLSILNNILNKSSDEYHRKIANDILKNDLLYENISIEESSSRGGANGWYDGNTNTIGINLNLISQYPDYNSKFEEVVLHELLHSSSDKFLDAPDDTLTKTQLVARNKINSLLNEYRKSYQDQDKLNNYLNIFNRYTNDKKSISTEERQFLIENKNELYPMVNSKEFVAAGLTNIEFRNTLKDNNLWNRLIYLISNLLGINKNDLDFLYQATIELTGRDSIVNNVSEDISESILNFHQEEYDRVKFVEQRDNFFNNYKIKDYFNDIGKKYSPKTQQRFLLANDNPIYNRIKVGFWNNELRVSRSEVPIVISEDISDSTVQEKTKNEKFIDRTIARYEANLRSREKKQQSLGEENADPKLDALISNLKDKIKSLKEEQSVIYTVDSIEGRMNLIEEGLNSKSNGDDLFEYNSWLNEMIIIADQVDFSTGTDLGKEYNDKINNISGNAIRLKRLWRDKAIKYVESVTNQELDTNFNIQDWFKNGVKDVGSLESGNLDSSQSSSEFIQTIGYLIDNIQDIANTYHSEFESEFAEINAEFISKYKNYNVLLQSDDKGNPTGFLINKYKDDFYKKSKGDLKFWRANTVIKKKVNSDREFEEDRLVAQGSLSSADYINWLKENDPNLFIKDYNGSKKFNRFRPANKYVDIRPKDEWLDDKYSKLKSLGENDPAVKFFNYIEPILRRNNRKYKQQINYIPEISKSTLEHLLQGKIKGAVSNMWENFTEDLDSEVYDTKVDIDDVTGEPRLSIPTKMFSNRLSAEDKSYDLSEIVSSVVYQEEILKAKHEFEPLLNMYYSLLKDTKSIVGKEEDGTPILANKEANRLTEQTKYMIDTFIYGKGRADNEAERKYGKTTDRLVSYYRLLGMGYNPFSAIGNVMQGFMSNYTFAMGGNQYFDINDYTKATTTMMHSIAGNSGTANKIRNAFELFDTFVKHNELNFGKSKKLQSPRNKISEYAEPFNMQQRGEYFVQGQTMVGILMSQKVENKNGEKVSLWEAFDENMQWNSEEYGENPYKDRKKLFKMKMLIRKAIIDAHGNYARPIQNKKHFYNRALYVFRTWLPQAINNRLGSESTDVLLGITTKGRYRSIPSFFKNSNNKIDFNEARQNLLWLLKLNSETNLSEVDKTNMRKNLGELLLLSAITAAILMMRSGLTDDEDEYYVYLLNNLIRAQGDLTLFMSPAAFDAVLQDPIPLMSIVRNVYDVQEAAFSTIMGEPLFKTGFRKDQFKLAKELGDFIPGWTQLDKNISYMSRTFTR